MGDHVIESPPKIIVTQDFGNETVKTKDTELTASGTIQVNDISVPVTLARDFENDSSQYCETTKCITEFVGKTFVGVGILGTVYFFTAPAMIPLTAAGVAGSAAVCLLRSRRSGNPSNVSDDEALDRRLNLGLLLGAAVGGVTGYYTWKPVEDFVHSSQAAALAGITGAAITAFGGVLWAASCCGKKKTESS